MSFALGEVVAYPDGTSVLVIHSDANYYDRGASRCLVYDLHHDAFYIMAMYDADGYERVGRLE